MITITSSHCGTIMVMIYATSVGVFYMYSLGWYLQFIVGTVLTFGTNARGIYLGFGNGTMVLDASSLWMLWHVYGYCCFVPWMHCIWEICGKGNNYTRTYLHYESRTTRTCSSPWQYKNQGAFQIWYHQEYHDYAQEFCCFDDCHHIAIEGTIELATINHKVCNFIYQHITITKCLT